jgi:hypothetical protein
MVPLLGALTVSVQLLSANDAVVVTLLLPIVPAHTLPVIVPGQSVMLEKVLPMPAVAVEE